MALDRTGRIERSNRQMFFMLIGFGMAVASGKAYYDYNLVFLAGIALGISISGWIAVGYIVVKSLFED